MTELVAQMHRCVATSTLDPNIIGALQNDKGAVQECEVLDFKQQLPDGDFEYAKLVRDLLALHNSYGGFIVFGVRETEKDRAFEIVGVQQSGIHIGKLRDMARAYLGTDLRISVSAHALDGRHVEAVWVAKRSIGDSPLKFAKNGPEEKPGKPCFKRGEVVFRRIESNAIAQHPDDYDFLYSTRRPPSIELSLETYATHDPLEHSLPDRALVCSRFVGRRDDLGDLWSWLADDFSRVRLIAGEGGLGKTSLAYRFAEEVASRRVKPFEQVVWLTAKKRQFIPSDDSHQENRHTDFEDANSLFLAIASAHGCVDTDFDGLDSRELFQLAIESCAAMPSFLVVDDVDSLAPEDQQRALELGMRTPVKTKMLLTTRVNFSYSPDNVLKLNGIAKGEFREYVHVVRSRYSLPVLKESKIDHLHEVSGGSPLFTDSLMRLERRGLSLDQAITQWKGEKGLEARKEALQREVQQLGREAKRVLFVISHVKSASYVELSQILGYTEQTLGDALQELAGLFLVSAPSIGREARYTVEPNTGLLVLELSQTLGIDHAALVTSIKRARTDAVGLSLQKRSGIVGLAIAQAIALLKNGDSRAAFEAVTSASKQLSKPNADLLLAVGRFSLKLDPPNREQAIRAFTEAYALGQRKQLLFDLWFDAEYGRSSLDSAVEVATSAIDHQVGDAHRWFERRAQVHIALAQRSGSKVSIDSAVREVDLAIVDLRKARDLCSGDIQYRQMDLLLSQALKLRKQLTSTT
ncbi:RNA-binding domain-containing protein [Verminephrobacter eiseniae]|uniref:RNA-binding domain-containing protein n=1 Tax=Verminephrobacter eiseniae TaxID=364317 RepID=UPI00223787AE|nr:RNA-binding domain-containing protein [Verminephrobacter eiseniae]